MKYFFKSTAFRVVFGTVLFISGVLLYTSIYVDFNMFSDIVSSAAVPVQKGVRHIYNWAFDYAYQLKSKQELQGEIEDLKKEISGLRDLTVDYYNLKRENARFAKYYDFKQQNNSLKFVSAAVVGVDPGEYFGNFVIDQGADSGISLNDAVITENGVVGYISQINSNSARVKTILSPDAKMGVVDIQNNECGVLSGSLELASKNLTRMTLIPAQNSIKPEDIIVTLGLSGTCPKNFKVGKVKSIEYDNNEASYYASLEPFENLKSIRDVFVITNFQGKGEIAAEAGGEHLK